MYSYWPPELSNQGMYPVAAATKAKPSDIGTSSYLGNMSDLGSSDLGPGMMEHTSDLDSVCPEDGGSKSQLWPL